MPVSLLLCRIFESTPFYLCYISPVVKHERQVVPRFLLGALRPGGTQYLR